MFYLVIFKKTQKNNDPREYACGETTTANEDEVGLGKRARRTSACTQLTVCMASCQVVGLIWKVGDQMQTYLFSLRKSNFVFLGLFCFGWPRKTTQPVINILVDLKGLL